MIAGFADGRYDVRDGPAEWEMCAVGAEGDRKLRIFYGNICIKWMGTHSNFRKIPARYEVIVNCDKFPRSFPGKMAKKSFFGS